MPVLHLQDLNLGAGDALVVVDVQNDFLPGGSLAVPHGDEVIAALNRAIDVFVARGQPVFATRDWHPPNQCSFRARGGPWPPHCVQGTPGASFAPGLRLQSGTQVVSKGTDPERDAYSGFQGTDLADRLRAVSAKHLFVGGLATDYCVLNTVKDALDRDFAVSVLVDAVRAVDVNPGDGVRALDETRRWGAIFVEAGPHARRLLSPSPQP
ncbi:MAG: isochorismatase family protein [Deltaproteobacteria bacterium]|nr:isochorismatase family protein [Deltaproteobacteria bacterium]